MVKKQSVLSEKETRSLIDDVRKSQIKSNIFNGREFTFPGLKSGMMSWQDIYLKVTKHKYMYGDTVHFTVFDEFIVSATKTSKEM